jgi:hypothetical protein
MNDKYEEAGQIVYTSIQSIDVASMKKLPLE